MKHGTRARERRRYYLQERNKKHFMQVRGQQVQESGSMREKLAGGVARHIPKDC